ncbi:LPXTG cell wall anchor domain-containing protein [Candidatus Gottesmanbacteria bacterium]|nr:LPXTG cell wall anchor domain-containing protein [Candidatus Gottesmanbacteria bacterium]
MSLAGIYEQVTNSATFFGLLFLIAVALWLLVFKKIEKSAKK